MTYDEFLDHVTDTWSCSINLRLGQVFFNELCKLRPDISEVLRGSMLDPFFKERITQVTSDFVRNRW